MTLNLYEVGNRITAMWFTYLEEIKTILVRFLSGGGFSHDSIKAVIRDLSDKGFFKQKKTRTPGKSIKFE